MFLLILDKQEVLQLSIYGVINILYTSKLNDVHNGFWRHGSPMVSALDSTSSGPDSTPSRGYCVVFLGKTLYSHSASLQPGVQMGTCNGKFGLASHPGGGGGGGCRKTPSRFMPQKTG